MTKTHLLTPGTLGFPICMVTSTGKQYSCTTARGTVTCVRCQKYYADLTRRTAEAKKKLGIL